MSTIKSDSENLTLNAHGSGNDIKFQSNSVEVGSISDAGLMTATLFAGSGASLTNIPAAQITGTLPAISGANLTSLDAADVSGTHTAFRSTGIDDNADALAITIGSDETVGIGVVPEAWHSSGVALQVGAGGTVHAHTTDERIALISNAYEAASDGNWYRNVAGLSGKINIDNGTIAFQTAATGSADGAVSWTTPFNMAADGNIGIGVTPEAWNTGLHALQIGETGAITGGDTAWGGYLEIGSNFYRDSGGFKYTTADTACLTEYDNSNGKIVHKVAGSGSADAAITWTNAMTIDNSGHVTLGGRNKWLAGVIHDLGTMAASATVTVSEGVGCNGAYEIAVWNTDGNAYGHGLYTFCCGGYNSNFTIQTAYESHYGATDVPTVSFVRVSGCNWQLRVTNNDGDSKHFYASIRCVHSQ